MERQAERVGFTKWVPLARLCLDDMPEYGALPALYALGSRKTGACLKLGHTKDLRQRLLMNYMVGYGGETTKYIHRKLFDDGLAVDTEVSWLVAPVDESARREAESKLIADFIRIFGTRPLWDRETWRG